MKRVLTLAAALLVFGATSALAQAGLNLYWNGCSVDGATAATFACNTNSGSNFMYGSVVLGVDMTDYLGTSAVVDMTFESGAIPDWWAVNAGGCRANSASMSFDPNNNATGCTTDIWNFNNPTPVTTVQTGIHGANWVRLNGAAAIPAGSEIPLNADGTEYWVFRISINHQKTAGTGACAGCDIPACIVLNECKLQTPLGAHDQQLTQESTNRWLTWNGTPTNCPASTPALNRTWGAVKNLYR